jgi:DNA-binding MarR family transcriptional regulator
MQGHSLLITPAGQDALLTKPMSKTDYRVLWWLARNLPAGGSVTTLSAIAEGCCLVPSVVKRTLNVLIKGGFVRRVSKVGISYHYRLNTNWFGFV